MKIRIGIGLTTRTGVLSGEGFGSLVDALEHLGFDSLWLSERLTADAPDPMVGLAVAAGRTTRLKLGTSVQVLPGRNPVDVAKAWATLDRLSDGRALPAFGLGVRDPAEQQAFGIRRQDRAAWLEEALPLVRRFWTEDAVTHSGPRFQYDGLTVRPKPHQQPPDIWLGGIARSELERIGRLADGWLPSFCTPDEAARGRALIESTAAAHDRQIDPEHYGALVLYLPDGQELPTVFAEALKARRPDLEPAALLPVGHVALAEQLERYCEQGVSKFVVAPAAEPRGWQDELARLADAVLPLQN